METYILAALIYILLPARLQPWT